MYQDKKLIQALDADTVARQALIRHINSPYYAFEKRVTDMRQAIALLGTETILSFITSQEGRGGK